MLEHIELGLTYQIDLSQIKWSNYRSLLMGQAGRRKRGRPITNL